MKVKKPDSVAILRVELDRVYDKLFPLLAWRAILVDGIGAKKARLGLPALDSVREQEVLDRCRSSLKAAGKSEETIALTVESLKALMASARSQEKAASRR
jgi:chorismate mutase